MCGQPSTVQLQSSWEVLPESLEHLHLMWAAHAAEVKRQIYYLCSEKNAQQV